jgi:hypothetical protein
MVKTSSGATAVQIVYSSRRGSREIEHLGSGHSGAEVELLKAVARQRLAAGRSRLQPGKAGSSIGETCRWVAGHWRALLVPQCEKPAWRCSGRAFVGREGAAMDDAAKRVPLAEFVAGLREELRTAQAARDPGLQFAVGPVSVEFTVVASREGGPEAKVRFWVVEAGGSAKWSREATQKMSMTLTPVDEHGQPIYIIDRVPGPPP